MSGLDNGIQLEKDIQVYIENNLTCQFKYIMVQTRLISRLPNLQFILPLPIDAYFKSSCLRLFKISQYTMHSIKSLR